MEEIGQKILSACSPRPMLMGAQRNALRAFNAGVLESRHLFAVADAGFDDRFLIAPVVSLLFAFL